MQLHRPEIVEIAHLRPSARRSQITLLNAAIDRVASTSVDVIQRHFQAGRRERAAPSALPKNPTSKNPGRTLR